jgi:hypothetical protein
MQLYKPNRHHNQIGHHLIASDELPESADHVGYAAADFGYQFSVHFLRVRVPVPSILKGGDLRVGLVTALVLEKHVIGAAGIEGRIQVDQVYAFAFYVLSEDRQVIAVKESVFHLAPLGRYSMKY